MKPKLSQIRSCVQKWPGTRSVLSRHVQVADLEQFQKSLPAHRNTLDLDKIESFTQQFSGLQDAHLSKHRTEAPQANVFRILRLGADELRHSRFLAWLLDDQQSHLQGAIFFRAFLLALDVDQGFAEQSYEVWRERPDRIDISIHSRHRFAIYIENKIDAGEGPEQLAREYRSLRRWSGAGRWNVPASGRVLVFLTPDGRLPDTLPFEETLTSATFVALSYSKLVTHLLAAATSDRCDSEYIRRLVRDYVGVVRDLIAR